VPVRTVSVLRVVLWRWRDTLRLRDLAATFLERGVGFSHEAVGDWAARFAPLLAARLRARRHGQAGAQWHTDETVLLGRAVVRKARRGGD